MDEIIRKGAWVEIHGVVLAAGHPEGQSKDGMAVAFHQHAESVTVSA